MKHRNLARLSESHGTVNGLPQTTKNLISQLLSRLRGKSSDKTSKMITHFDYDSDASHSAPPSSREEGTSSLASTYRDSTPGQKVNEELSAKEIKDRNDYKRWRQLVNMGPNEIQAFLDSQDGKKAGLSRKEASTAGAGGGRITSGRDSARAIIRMKSKPFSEWDESDKRWMRKQISFISRMSGNPGKLRDEQGRPTRKLLSLKVWGHNPGKR